LSIHDHAPGVLPVAIEAIAYYLPAQCEDGASLVAENPDWRPDDIERKTGILKRHITAAGETTLDLACHAGELLFDTGVDKAGIDALILVTQSPVSPLPATACRLQDRLGLGRNCMAFDVNQGCSGFVYGLAIGASLIESGVAARVLLVCSETYSKYIGKHDRTCRPVFGDGAAATVLSRRAGAAMGPFELGSDGAGAENLVVHPGADLHMNGATVFMFTMSEVPKSVHALLRKAGRTLDDVDLFVFHQASKVVIDNITRHLALPEDKVFRNYAERGNTVSATIPIALVDAMQNGRLHAGDLVLVLGFGVGYSWGGALLTWGDGVVVAGKIGTDA
jgi:3-oxoacyl-[acyl-carrier-protein] synthase-3